MSYPFRAGNGQKTFDDFVGVKRSTPAKRRPVPESGCRVQFNADGSRTWFCREHCRKRKNCEERREE